jgi:phage terminase small subunit
MPGPLKNARHERFAQELAKGASQAEAYARAGYKPSEQHASRLARNGKVRERLAQLQSAMAEKAIEIAAIDAAWVLRQVNHTGLIEYKNLSDEEIEARIAAHQAGNGQRPTAH